MSNPKRHHYIPEMLQRRFVNGRGMLYYFNKKQPNQGVSETGQGNLFVENNLHTKYEAGGMRDTFLETFYSKIEGTADTIIDRIVTSARRGHCPALSAIQKQEWDEFLFFQWKRVPGCHNVLHQSFEGDLIAFRNSFEREYRPLTSEERASFDDPEWKARLRQNVRAD